MIYILDGEAEDILIIERYILTRKDPLWYHTNNNLLKR
jgi:hypothetical protein